MIAGPRRVGWNRAFLLLCLAVTPAMAGSWEREPSESPENTTDRPTVTQQAQRLSGTDSTDRSASVKRSPSRWERFRNSLSPFRPKVKNTETANPARNEAIIPKPDSNPTREDDRRRWLIGRNIQFEPERDPGTTETERAKTDRRVSQAAYEAEQVPSQSTLPSLDALPPSMPDSSGFVPGALNSDNSAPGQMATPPSPSLPQADPGGIAANSGNPIAEAEEAALPGGMGPEPYGLCKRWMRGYPTLVEWFPKHLGPPRKSDSEDPATQDTFRAGERSGGGGYETPGAPRRSPPSPWDSPPFPGSEYQGYPLIGTPVNPGVDPLQKALLLGPHGKEIEDSRIEVHGWATVSGNWSNAIHSNLPTAYWIVPNSFQLDQAVVKFEREIDWVQTDHIDWGFRSVHLFGIDYRYTTAGGWFSQQLLYHNNLYGYDPVELWFEVYVPKVFEGFVIRVGRWIACPDIEAQYAPDNYLASHSLLFTYDTYTQTGAMFSFQLNKRNMVQGAIQSGTDMAPWYPGALPTGFFGWRWISQSNNDAFYTCLNNINNGKFRYFYADGHKAGHDNFNYIVTTWEHRFSQKVHTKTEAYYMWQFDAVVGGTPSLGPPIGAGGGGGLGTYLKGNSPAYGVLNYTMFQLSKRDYFTIRNEWWRDQRGERSGFATNYSSHTIGISHQFNDLVMLRPEIGYYHSYDVPAFDLGKKNNLLMYGFDLTIRF